MVELGGGAGTQIEVIRKLHPHICFLLFDLVPGAYVCERYLSTIFPNSVVSYRDTRQGWGLREPEPGKIFILGNWQFPLLQRVKVDLFWNAVSFQEMEPEVVSNYLKYVNEQAQNVYLRQRMGGKEIGRKGQNGVLRQTTLTDYEIGLANFRLVDLSPAWTAFGKLVGDNNYSDSFWKRVK